MVKKYACLRFCVLLHLKCPTLPQVPLLMASVHAPHEPNSAGFSDPGATIVGRNRRAAINNRGKIGFHNFRVKCNEAIDATAGHRDSCMPAPTITRCLFLPARSRRFFRKWRNVLSRGTEGKFWPRWTVAANQLAGFDAGCYETR